MFKYIAAILKTISPAQRLIALSIVLLAITLISIVPNMTNSFTQDTEELKSKIGLQRTEISDLTIRVTELNKQVIDNQRECTNEIVQKEKDILSMITEIEFEAAKPAHIAPTIRAENQMNINAEISMTRMNTDSEVSMVQVPKPQIIKVSAVNTKMIMLVKKLKKNIQTDLSDRR
jgi:hypothetical protein